MKKKLAIALFACMMALSLAACGSSNTSNVSGSVSSASAASEEASTSASAADAGSDEADDNIELGTSEGDTYANDYFEVTWTLPEGWTFYDSEQLAQVNVSLGDLTDDEAVKDALESGSTAIDMIAQSADSTNNVNVALEGTNAIAAAVAGEEQILDSAMDAVEQQLASQGATDVQTTRETIEFCGKTCQNARISLSMNGIALHENLVLLKKGNYLMMVTATTALEDGTDALLAQFQAV